MSGEKNSTQIYLAAITIILIGFGCKKKSIGEDQYVTLSYVQTYCADAWQNSTSDSTTRANVSAYLASQSLYVASITIQQDKPVELCQACSCKSGKTIYVSTFNNAATIAAYLQLGFKQ